MKTDIAQYNLRIRELHEKRARLCSEFETLDQSVAGQEERAKRLKSGWEKIDAELEGLREAARAALAAQLAAGEVEITQGSVDLERAGLTLHTPYSGDPWSGGDRMEIRDRARRALDTLDKRPDDLLRDSRSAIAKVTDALDGNHGEQDMDALSRWAAATSDPAYLRAMTRLFRDPVNGHRAFADDELKSYQRAMSLTSNAGGYLAPFQLDPAVTITADGSFNEVRKVARQVVATSNTWNGVTSGGSTASWDNEAVEVSDDSATYAGPQITVCKEQIFVPISLEAMQDEMNVAQAVVRQLDGTTPAPVAWDRVRGVSTSAT
jgi:predicted phage gp36 major capsid-like protein